MIPRLRGPLHFADFETDTRHYFLNMNLDLLL